MSEHIFQKLAATRSLPSLALFHNVTLESLPVSPSFGSERACCWIVVLELGAFSQEVKKSPTAPRPPYGGECIR